MRPRCLAAVLGLGVWAAWAAASPVVVDDSACLLHAVDIQSFATCEGERVAMPEEEVTVDRKEQPASGLTDHAQAVELNTSDQTAVQPNS